MTPEDLKQIKARCEAATEGAWQWRKFCQNAVHMHTPDMIEICQFVWGADGVPMPSQVEGNFIFIAHARQDLPACLDEIERLKDILTTITTKHNLLMSVSVYGPCKCKGSVLCMKHAAEDILKMIKEFGP